MDKLRSGVFYTIGFFLLAGLLLSVSIISFKNFNYSQERFNEAIVLDRVYELEKSIEEGFRDIIRVSARVSINKIGSNINFIEGLPNSNADNFSDNLEAYKLFLEKNFSVLLDINDLKTRFPLNIQPHNIEYYHENFGDNIIKVSAENSNFDGYTISITTTENLDGTSCRATGSQQDVYVKVFATGSNGSCSSESSVKSKITLENSENDLIATIELTGNDLAVTETKPINITTSIDELYEFSDSSVVLPKEVLYLNFTKFNVKKNSTIVIL